MGRSHLCSSLWNVQIIRWITSSLRHIAVLRNITVVSYKFCWILYCWLGNNIIWYWIFFGHHRMAYIRNDIGGLWLYCALQVNWALPVLLLFCDLINYSPLFISVCFFFFVPAVGFGQHWLFFCRRYLFLDGYFSNHIFDLYVGFAT